jgi:hypothetical protein
MGFNFKKIAAIGTSLLLTGMSMGFAAAAAFPGSYSPSTTAVVYGASADPSDMTEATSIQTALGTTSSSGSSVTVSGGDSIHLATNARNLYYGDPINLPYPSLSATEMPNALADGTFTDLSGTQYTYSQTITPGATASVFGISGGDYDDPVLYLDVGTDTTAPLYNYTLSFNKNLNVSDATNVQGQTISIMGVDYVIGASSTNSTLYLYGAGQTVTVDQGTPQTLNIGGGSHTISVTPTGANTATLYVDGVSRSVTQGNSYSFSGDINIYVKAVTYQAYSGGAQSADLIVGANTLKLVDGSTVKQGADLTSIKGTTAHITAAGIGQISAITVSVAAPKSSEDSLQMGDTFTDPVFGGLQVVFAGINPALDDSSRGTVVVDGGSLNTQQAKVTFTSAKAGSAGEQTLTYAYDNSTTGLNPALAHQSFTNGKGYIHVLEGETAKTNDWIVLNQGDSGAIVEVSDISIDNANTGTVTLVDAITGDSVEITVTNDTKNNYVKTGVNMFGGTGYTINATGDGTTVKATWNSGASALFPRIKLADGGWIAFMQNTTVANATSVIFPNGKTTLDTSGTTVVNSTASYSANGLIWVTENNAGNVKVTGVNVSATSGITFGVGPAVLIAEPKKWNDSSYGDYILVPMTTANSGKDMAVSQAVLGGVNSGFLALTSDSYENQAVDQYGTFITDEQRTNQNGKETISYPASQMTFDVVFSSADATVSGGSGGVGAQMVKDSAVSSLASGTNLVVVGGSCINSAAASLLGVSAGTCGADWTAATAADLGTTGLGSGQFLIESYSTNTMTSGMALLVAGTDAADTVAAGTYLTTNMPDVAAGKKWVGTTSTSTASEVSSA